jgi:peptidoglycan-N-acetylglucosamine deacetylase
MTKKPKAKPLASISLDLDNQWSYMKIHGDNGWDNYPSYFSIFVPHVLQVLQRIDCTITFFIVGKDADIEANRPYLRRIVDAGHEIGNHSYHHESWLKSYSKSQLEQEIDKAEKAIFTATNRRTNGFRGPGFSWSPDLFHILEERGYAYDASTLPTYLGPLARQYYFMTAKLSPEERKDRAELFGQFSDGLRPVKPYLWQLPGEKKLLEIPVTTIPILKTPFHFSYLLYLSGFSMLLMRCYLHLAIRLCRLTGTSPSYLLHPLDLIGGDQLPELRFFPGMDIGSARKLKVFTTVLQTLQKSFQLVPMGVHAQHLLNNRRQLRNRLIH